MIRKRAVVFRWFVVAAALLGLMSLSGCSQKRAAYEPPAKAEASSVKMASPAAPVPAKASAAKATEAKDIRSEAKGAGKTGHSTQPPRPGLLTAGEWSDNKNFDFLLNLMESNEEWREFARNWAFNLSGRNLVTVKAPASGKASQKPVANAAVELLDAGGQVLWAAKTDNTGLAYVFKGFDGLKKETANPALVRVKSGSTTEKQKYVFGKDYAFTLPVAPPGPVPGLDLMLAIDTTGSMGDELEYLKSELANVITRVRHDNANIPVRLSINVYRDHGDEYVVLSTPFVAEMEKPLNFLADQSAGGGGDYEEAVELALADAVLDHDWNPKASARLLFLVLDAPPHKTPEIRATMSDLMNKASAEGIRIIPVASSGVDKNTEFLMRSLSVTSGGTYVFLTDDSGIGNPHIKPTVGPYNVEPLNDLLVRVINRYLK